MTNSLILPKAFFIILSAVLLFSLPPPEFAETKENLEENAADQEQRILEDESEGDDQKKLIKYQRTNYIWPYAAGPYYGDAPASLMHSAHYLKTMVGSFDTRGSILELPGELRKGLDPLSETGMQYFIVQFTPEAFDKGGFQNLRKELEGMGVKFFDYLPKRSFIVLLNQANHGIVSGSSTVKFIEPYHPAFKISPNVGRMPLLDPAKATSPIYSLNVMTFPIEKAELVAQTISKMGGFVKNVTGDTINVDIDRNLIGEIAKIESVRAIFEETPIILHGEETTSTVQAGSYSAPNMPVPYFDVGIDGGGSGEADPQRIQIIDTGASVDAADLSETDSMAGTPSPTHRKVFLYKTTNSFGGTGDLYSCDASTSGGYTHGHVVSSTALGNASDVPPSYGTPYYFYGPLGNEWKIYGVAKGALLLMYDCYDTPYPGPCDEGCDPGDLYTAPSGGILGDGYYYYNARVTNLSWGSSVDQTYGAQPIDIDKYLSDHLDAMVFLSAGDQGEDSDDDGTPDEETIYSPANAKNAVVIGATYNSNTSSIFNPESRADFSGVGPVGSDSGPRVAPLLMAPGDDAFGAGSNMGLDSEYACRSSDNDQYNPVECIATTGSSGTSFASAAGSGAAALIRDYFAQGFYPDGTSTNDNNGDDKIANISGALVKAVLIASADWMEGPLGNLTKAYRNNYEQGYGRIQLSNALPLATDPSTTTGLIIKDEGLNTGTPIIPGTTVQDTFEVTNADEPLRIALAWVEGFGTDLQNDLDLIVAYDADDDGVIDPDEPTWWGNYFTEDWLQDDPGTIPVDLIRDGALESKEDNDGDGTLDESEWSLQVIDPTVLPAKAQKDFLNPQEAVFISVEDLSGGGTISELTGQWIWRIEADAANPGPQRYGLVIAGGIVRASSISFDAKDALCSDIIHVTVKEFDQTGDPGSSLTPSEISSRTSVLSIDPGPDGEIDTTDDVTYDTETGIAFTQIGSTLQFESEDLPVSASAVQIDNDGILSVANSYYLKAAYQDEISGLPDEIKSHFIPVDCTVHFRLGDPIEQWGRDYAYKIEGGCEINGLGRSFPDRYIDSGEKVVYWVSIRNDDNNLLNVEAELNAYVPGTQTPSPYITVLDPIKDLGFLPAGETTIIPFDVEFNGSPLFPTEVDMVLGLSAKEGGKPVKTYKTFTHLINADEEVTHYSTDYPTGGTELRDYNNDEYVDLSQSQLDAPGEDWDLWYEKVDFEDMTTTAFGGGNPGHTSPWDFDTDDEGFRSAVVPGSTQGSGTIANWGEDINGDGSLQAHEDRDPVNGQLDQNWALQSPSIPQEGYQTPYGIWRTGSTNPHPKQKMPCMGPNASSYLIQWYETRSGINGEEFWFEILKTPVINKVHVTPDANGYDYYAEFPFMSLKWNQMIDLADDFAMVTYEVDTDTETGMYTEKGLGVDLFDLDVLGQIPGPMTSKSGGDGYYYPLGGYSIFDEGGSAGNDRAGSVGCYFQDVTPGTPLEKPDPSDDDMDNDFDGSIDEFVTDNGPIRNMDTHRNNGLSLSTTLEDLYGDAGEKFQAAFGFIVMEGTSFGTPDNGYGLAIDDVALEWDEIHPVEDNANCALNGQCAAISIKMIGMYEPNTLVPVTVLDFNAETTQAVDGDSDGLMEVEVLAYSEAEPGGEYFLLEQTSTGSFQYYGVVPLSSAYNSPGTIYIENQGAAPPTLSVQYIDRHDGIHDWSQGADGQPGVSGVDDDSDGTIDEEDEQCPLGAGGILRPYGDDSCGCLTNPIAIDTTIEYPVGQLVIENVSVVSDNGDDDGYADACETVTIDITLRNYVTSGGEFTDLTSVYVTIDNVFVDSNSDGSDDLIACVLDPMAAYGDIPALGSKTNPSSDRFQFQVNCDVDRTSIYEELNGSFTVNVTANEIGGVSQPISFHLPLDLDASGSSLEEPVQFEDFESPSHKFEFLRVNHQDGIRCQYNDPDNPNGMSYGRSNCEIDTLPAYMDQDWHIHDSTMPDGGRAYLNNKSLHWGYHRDPADPAEDTSHFQEMHVARVKSGDKINLGLGNPVLSFKHQINLADDRLGNPPGEASDRAILMIAKTDDSGDIQCDPGDSDLCWIKMHPYDNAYHIQGTDQYVNCTFDPIDDGSNEDDFFPNSSTHGPSSTCNPEFVWSWLGDTSYDASYDPNNVGAGNGPGLAGSLGPGTWVESKFNLYRLRGYQIRLRFLVTTIENFPAQSYYQAGYGSGIPNDDGWYIDDIQITNRLTNPIILTDDSHASTPAPTCPYDPSQNCNVVTAIMKCLPDGIDNDQDGTIDETGEDNCRKTAPGQSAVLTAIDSYADTCVDGALQYQFWEDVNENWIIDALDEILYEWSSKSWQVVAPDNNTIYCAQARCTTDTYCSDYTCSLVDVYSYLPGPITYLHYQEDARSKTTFEWNGDRDSNSYDVIKGDLDQLVANDGDFSTTVIACLENDITDTTATDTDEPSSPGQGFYYLVRGNNANGNGTYSTGRPEEESGRDTEIDLSPNKCP